MPERKTFTIEDASIIYRNFEGREDKFNAKGNRNFSVVLEPEIAEQMEKDGWNVKWREAQEEGEDPWAYIQVTVSYKVRPPQVTMLTSTSRTLLTEDMLETLDYADIKQVDLICNGYDWEVNGKTGTKAYLQTMFVIINEDELMLKYANFHPEYEIHEENE